MFKSDFHSVAQFSQVIRKACVLFLREYLKYLPKVSLCALLSVCTDEILNIYRATLRMMCMSVRVAMHTSQKASRKSRYHT